MNLHKTSGATQRTTFGSEALRCMAPMPSGISSASPPQWLLRSIPAAQNAFPTLQAAFGAAPAHPGPSSTQPQAFASTSPPEAELDERLQEANGGDCAESLASQSDTRGSEDEPRDLMSNVGTLLHDTQNLLQRLQVHFPLLPYPSRCATIYLLDSRC